MNIITRLLEIVSNFPNGVLQTYLAKALGISKSYLSLLLKDLESQGVIYRIKVGNTYIVKKAVPHNVLDRREPGRILRLGIVWSSEYLFLGHFVKQLKDKEGIEVKVYVYPSAMHATMALIRGDIDAVLSPLVTQIYGYILSKSFVVVGGGAGGGGYIYELPHSTSNTVISSEASTMDLCRFIALKRRYIDASKTEYFSSIHEALTMIKKGSARYIVVWHPLNLEAEAVGGRKILNCLDLEEASYCCTLALSRAIEHDLIDRISRVYRGSIEVFTKDRERFLEWYSAIVGINLSVVKKALNEYTYAVELEPKYISKLLDVLGLEVPTKERLYQAIQP